ncbi:MAG: lipopolysaccharide biosynthesis protein RfbH [Pseudomonadota bacterium]|nr:lipopolysaccharide biosynthesis protein RfbH [Pseudomonadota bacterium]
MNDAGLRKQIRDAVGDYYRAFHEPRQQAPFVPGETFVPVSGKVYDGDDMTTVMEALLDFWLTAGRFAQAFEKSFAEFLGVRHALLCNSGSSANLLAIAALTSPRLKERRLRPGDEVITLASGFPTTVNPIIQQGMIPVFVDVHIPTYNVDVSQLEAALGPRTKAVFLPHTLGNPFALDAVEDFCRARDLWLIEDSCDALGAVYKDRLVGGFGDLATFSFYPAHHITMGEGGAVVTGDGELKKIIASLRDWGRDCWCETGHNDTCRRRFEQQFGDLPFGYDHKYVYSHIGYNLKLTDFQAALGVSQLKKLPRFIETRRKNFGILYEGLKELEEFFILPEATAHSEPSWFGFPLAVRPEAPFTRHELIRHLDQAKIDTRLLFGGNLTRQPAYRDAPHRKVGPLANSDFVMNQVFWIGVYPGLRREMLDYILSIFEELTKKLGER